MKQTVFKYLEPDKDVVTRLREGLNCSIILATLLAIRGITSVEKARFFLHPTFENLTDPFLLKDMDKAVERIFTAVENKEKILIFGDFDADGVTSTALIYEFFEYCGANVSWYIPHRIKEGYSLAPDHIHQATDQDIDLIITVDCGITSHMAVELAKKEDIDVIITDHHEPQTDLPKAVAVINPKRKDCSSGLSYLAGVGVAFFLVMALRKYFREHLFWEDLKEPNLMHCLDLFTIGTIGDMVPLIHDNRLLCIAGFDTLRKGLRPGLKALAQSARTDISKLDSDDISFKIVPRINAAGRISHARICVSQLTDTHILQAQNTASILDQLNTKRQIIEQEIVSDIENRILKDPTLLDHRLLFLWDDKWNPSVLGIAASKLTRKYHFPVILLSTTAEDAVGSGRSVNGINIHTALKENMSILERFGGHAMAAGLTVKKKNLSLLRKNLEHHIQTAYSEKDFQKTLPIDAVLNFEDITFELAKDIDTLRPFGTENPEPVFISKNIHVAASYIIGLNHRKMILEQGKPPLGNKIEAFQFNLDTVDDLPDFYSEIVFRLKINKFKADAIQIIIENP